ncbi:DUF1629 domain-containing protein [Stenotrophomonas lacuserhaii]|uniref:DUF1629 domain-containing protein n=1 Tax=Stenotrophomonas lacuserhaii TaxID=2760084 RepID=UPI0032EEC5E5
MTQTQPQRGEYFLLQPDTTRGGRGHGVVFENVKKLRTPPRMILRPTKGGFPELSETPRLVYSPDKGDPPQDLEGGISGYWMVSRRLKQVLSQVDPDGFEFVEADYRLSDGTKGPPYYLCDVIRELDALDEVASRLTIEESDEYPAGKFYDLTGGSSLAFRKDAVGDAHVFRTPYSGRLVFCDRRLRDAIFAAGMGETKDSYGVWFTDAADI